MSIIGKSGRGKLGCGWVTGVFVEHEGASARLYIRGEYNPPELNGKLMWFISCTWEVDGPERPKSTSNIALRVG